MQFLPSVFQVISYNLLFLVKSVLKSNNTVQGTLESNYP